MITNTQCHEQTNTFLGIQESEPLIVGRVNTGCEDVQKVDRLRDYKLRRFCIVNLVKYILIVLRQKCVRFYDDPADALRCIPAV